ncbi:hypothetical protein PIB30_042225 [Stylosanthes scabra]|uniref:FAR1 domain-containing protein n=1 Tax=Stylosanthes scabra TaxID=79078 RepID=A0ABU6XCW8_9FABA|nr:hypothetical protein [Stylosanthes scabra]
MPFAAAPNSRPEEPPDIGRIDPTSLDVRFDAVEVRPFDVGGGETQDDEGSNGVEHDPHANSSCTLDEVMRIEFDTPEEAVCFYKRYSRGKGFSMRHGRKLKNKKGEVVRSTFLCN